MLLARSFSVSRVRFPPLIPQRPLDGRPAGGELPPKWCALRQNLAAAGSLREALRRTPSIYPAALAPCPACRKPRHNRAGLESPRAILLTPPENRLAAKA